MKKIMVVKQAMEKIKVICDENLKDRNYLIDNKIKISKDYTKIDLSLNQVELILITSKNYEKGQIHDLFRIAQEKKDNNDMTQKNQELNNQINEIKNENEQKVSKLQKIM